MNATIISLAFTILLTIVNINTGAGKSNCSIYKNTEVNNIDNTSTVSMYKGENDRNLVPLKKYVTKLSSEGIPVEKICYEWNVSNQDWLTTCKYEYAYDIKNHIVGVNYTEWDQSSDCWKDGSFYTMYIYNDNGETLGKIYTSIE